MKKIHRFIGTIEIDGATARLIDAEVARQAKSVLKLRMGELITVCDGKGASWTGPLQGISKEEIEIQIEQTYQGEDGLIRDVTLYLAILKSEHFELAVQKAVESGVKKIVPMLSKRTIKLHIKQDRIERIIREAAEQSGRMVLPQLGEICSFEQAVDTWKISGESGVLFDGSGKQLMPSDLSVHVSCFIGPEGGWEEAEIQTAKQRGLHICQLGNLVLRAETAATIATFILAQQR